MVDITASQTAFPEGPQEMWAQFNKISGAYTGLFQKVDLEILDQTYYDYVAVEIDSEKQRIVGTKNNFTISTLAEEPILVTERALNNAAAYKIEEEYTIYRQLTILGEALEKCMNKLAVSDDKFYEMRSYIDEVKRVNDLLKADYAADPAYNYMSLSDEQEAINAQLEGGLHEAIGPRTLSPALPSTPIV